MNSWDQQLSALEDALTLLEHGELPDLPVGPGDLGAIPAPLRHRAEAVLERIAAVEGPLRRRRAEVARRRATTSPSAPQRGAVLRA